MTKEQADKIWKLTLNIQAMAFLYGASELTPEHSEKGIGLIRAKAKLYQYLTENIDDTQDL